MIPIRRGFQRAACLTLRPYAELVMTVYLMNYLDDSVDGQEGMTNRQFFKYPSLDQALNLLNLTIHTYNKNMDS